MRHLCGHRRVSKSIEGLLEVCEYLKGFSHLCFKNHGFPLFFKRDEKIVMEKVSENLESSY